MAILLDETTPIIVQGISGRIGSFHTGDMIKNGTNVVGGVTPGKGGQTMFDRPIFNTHVECIDSDLVSEALGQAATPEGDCFTHANLVWVRRSRPADLMASGFVFYWSAGRSNMRTLRAVRAAGERSCAPGERGRRSLAVRTPHTYAFCSPRGGAPTPSYTRIQQDPPKAFPWLQRVRHRRVGHRSDPPSYMRCMVPPPA